MVRKIPTTPNLLIIGAMKAGTTSLHNYLSYHPEIFMSERKELNFFDDHIRWHLGVDWYKSNFDAAFAINGEASPQYTRYPRTTGVPERIKQVLGSPKFIYIIRDPIERLLSHYTEVVDQGREKRPFREVLEHIESEDEGYVQCSSYFLQLLQYLNLFPPESILVIINERLRARPKETLQHIFRFLGVDEAFWSQEFSRELNLGEQKQYSAPWFENLAPAVLKQELRRRRWMPWRMMRTLRRISRWGGAPIAKPSITPAEDVRLQQLFRDDVASLKQFLRDPLPEWRPYV